MSAHASTFPSNILLHVRLMLCLFTYSLLSILWLIDSQCRAYRADDTWSRGRSSSSRRDSAWSILRNGSDPIWTLGGQRARRCSRPGLTVRERRRVEPSLRGPVVVERNVISAGGRSTSEPSWRHAVAWTAWRQTKLLGHERRRRHNAASDSHVTAVWLHLAEVAIADTAQYYVDGICRSSSWSSKTSRMLLEFHGCIV